MKRRLKTMVQENKGKCIGFGIYYLMFLLFSLVSVVRGWDLLIMRVLMLLVIGILLCVSIDLGENHAARSTAYRREPYVAQGLEGHDHNSEGFEVPTVLLLVAPPALYLIISFLAG